MDAQAKYNLWEELTTFLKDLEEFKRRLKQGHDISLLHKGVTKALREKLVRKAGTLRQTVIELTGKEHVSRFGMTYNIWDVGLTAHRESDICDVALDYCIDTVNEAIGKLESDIEMGVRDKQGVVIKEPQRIPIDTAGLPVQLFDKMQFHPKVVEASKSLFETGHYAQAIFEAFKAVNNFVKEKTGKSLDGKTLMSEVFSERNPVIKLSELRTQSERDEQEGFKFLFMGAMVGIRNPKAHDNVVQTDPYRTLEYLGFASLLMKRTEEGKVDTGRANVQKAL